MHGLRYLSMPRRAVRSRTPTVTALKVVPVAGRDSMLLNLSGAHGPFFTRNLVILDRFHRRHRPR